jgi:1,4-dihydroxy-2-naphthoyl-CoA hydrolase
MFLSKNCVRMHDTDMAGILYFPRQFRFAHDALEDFVTSYGFDFNTVFNKLSFVFVICHAEADYYHPLKVGDSLDIQLTISHIGTTSFTVASSIFCKETLVGTTKTVHVVLDSKERKKIPIPEMFLKILKEHLQEG